MEFTNCISMLSMPLPLANIYANGYLGGPQVISMLLLNFISHSVAAGQVLAIFRFHKTH